MEEENKNIEVNTEPTPVEIPAEVPSEIPAEPASVEVPTEVPSEAPAEPAPVEVPTEVPSEASVAPAPVEVPTEVPSEAPAEPVTAAAQTPEPKKKGKGGIVIIVLLLLALIGGGVFLAYNNGLFTKKGNKENPAEKDKDKDKKEPEKKKYEEETLSRESEVVQKLYRLFSEAENNEEIEEETTEAFKKRVVMNALEESDYTEKKCGDLDDIVYKEKDGLWLCSVDFGSDIDAADLEKTETLNKIKERIADKSATTISSEEFHKRYNTYFEGAFEDKTEFIGPCITLLYYDKVNSLYATNFVIPYTGCVLEPSVNVLKGINQENGQLTIETGLTIGSEKERAIDYTFKFDPDTGNYIFVSRTVN